ncbi:hypothetical protein LOTGIDRAFT_201667 [Lottia gigantea]|uniref:Aromatic-L-amino-acid decarboxylase n=1 Tax=Lottia gigantea TaxID=225164 RepID=V4AMV3_LOTGI|nr:hypothetical protein LOTGIDRAFT_201667 [Lottia gigantea]ESO98477.1 hypothetical protein LOTGIDRAFT_201667 [Lottia gigantea]
MDAEEFRKRGREMIDYVADYLSNIESRRPMPDVEPGYMKTLIREDAPVEPDQWEDVMKDIEPIIMKGVTHWHNPNFHAYFPTANSYPAILGDILSDGIACIGFSWAASPACTELEVHMMNWLGKMLNLPKEFLFSPGGHGGGVIQSTASEVTLTCLLSARTKIINQFKKNNPSIEEGEVISKLICYTSSEAHCSVEKAGLIGAVKMRILEPDEKGSLRGVTLEKAIKEDKAKGLVPFFICATLGTTGCCAFDNIKELGPICEKEDIWMHIDAAYAGSSFICPEYRPLLDGVEHAMSFNFNPHKWLQVTFDCSTLYFRVKDSRLLAGAFVVDPLYLKHDTEGEMPDYRHWHIPLGRRFRSLKLWFVLRLFGQKKLQAQIIQDIKLAKEFEKLVLEDKRFEISFDVIMALVCFRLKGTNEINEKLLKLISEDGRIHIVPSNFKEKYYLRFAVCATSTTSEHVQFAWKVITEMTDKLKV